MRSIWIYGRLWQIMAKYGAIWPEKWRGLIWVGGMWGDRSENPNSADSAIYLTRCLTLKGGRRIPVASRKPPRGDLMMFRVGFASVVCVCVCSFIVKKAVGNRWSLQVE